jgi:hypothetical protein
VKHKCRGCWLALYNLLSPCSWNWYNDMGTLPAITPVPQKYHVAKSLWWQHAQHPFPSPSSFSTGFEAWEQLLETPPSFSRRLYPRQPAERRVPPSLLWNDFLKITILVPFLCIKQKLEVPSMATSHLSIGVEGCVGIFGICNWVSAQRKCYLWRNTFVSTFQVTKLLLSYLV